MRVVAATWRDLRARAAEGAFRDDLRFRLATFEVALPPLRERGDDVVLLAEHVVAGLARTVGIGPRTLGRSAGAALRGYDWPGNVRELQAVLMRAAVLVKPGDAITGAQIRAVLPAKPTTEASVEDRLVALLTSAGEVGIGQVMAALCVPRTTAWRAMGVLVERGVVEATGLTKGRRYRLAAVESASEAMDPRWEQVLALARREGRVTRQAAVELLGVPERTAGRVLADLAGAGALVASGKGRNACYRPQVTRLGG